MRSSSSGDEDDAVISKEAGRGFTQGGFIDLSFCVFPSLKPPPDFKKKKKLASDPDPEPSNSAYVPWEQQVPPWRRLAKWMHTKYLVGMLARGKPAVLIIQTNHAPEHPARAAQRSKSLMNWANKELGVVGEVRLVIRARVQGAGLTLENQVSSAQEAESRDDVRAFLLAIGVDDGGSSSDSVIECLKEAELEPPEWVPFLEDLQGEEEEEGEGEEEKVKPHVDGRGGQA